MKRYRDRLLLVLTVFTYSLFCNAVLAAAQDGVLISKPRRPSQPLPTTNRSASSQPQDTQSLIEQYVQTTIVQTLLKSSGDIIRQIISSQQADIHPQIAYLAVNQTVLQTFEQPSTKEIIQGLYQAALIEALKEYNAGQSQTNIMNNIQRKVDSGIRSVLRDGIFQQIIELSLREAYAQQRELLIQQANIQQAKRAVAQQAAAQQQMVRRAAVEQMVQVAAARQQAVQQAIAQRMQQAIGQMQQNIMRQYEQQYNAALQQQYAQAQQQYVQAVQQQYVQAAQQQYQQALQQQYEQALQQQYQEFIQQYLQGVAQ